jgi:hypothetical protein
MPWKNTLSSTVISRRDPRELATIHVDLKRNGRYESDMGMVCYDELNYTYMKMEKTV